MKVVLPKHLTDLEAIELIWGPPEAVRDEEDLRDYQRWMADKAEEIKKVYLAAEMGLGKTAASLRVAARLLRSGEVRQVLIVAPLRVAEETWPAEIAAWRFARGIKFRVVTGTEEERIAALTKVPAQITIINRENLLWLFRRFGPVRWPYDMVIYDEASRLKSGKLKTNPPKNADGRKPPGRPTELGVLSKVSRKTKVLIELSGTPTPKGLTDLWGPMFLIDKGQRLGTSRTAFEQRWFRKGRDGYSLEPFDHSEGEIMGAVKGVFYSLREEDYLKLPPMVIRDHKVKLPDAAMKAYKEFERESAIWVRDGENDPEVIEALNSGVLTNKLLQFANGSLYRPDGSDIKIHDAKMPVLESIIEEAAGRPILCAYSFQFDKAAIKKKFPWVRIFGESKNDMRDWNAGKIRMLLTHPASAGHGLNFQHGSNIAVWYGLTWSMELYKQFIKRLHRSGQKAERVFLHRIVADGTADLDVLRVLSNREATQNRITDAVRVRMKRILR